MGALRTFVFLLIIFFGAWLVRRQLAHSARRWQQDRRKPKLVTEMRPCAYCGVHAPVSEGVVSHGAFYCSEEHRRAARNA